MKAPASTCGVSRKGRRRRYGVSSGRKPSAFATRSTKRAPTRRRSISSIVPVSLRTRTLSMTGAERRVEAKGAEKNPPRGGGKHKGKGKGPSPAPQQKGETRSPCREHAGIGE